jgi:hypothetical protein
MDYDCDKRKSLSCALTLCPLDFELLEEETCRATIRMFVDFNLVSQFHIPYDVSPHAFTTRHHHLITLIYPINIAVPCCE